MSPPDKVRNLRAVSGKEFPRFSEAIAGALRKEFGGTHAAIKTVVNLTGANERSVKNWFAARNGPSGEHLIVLTRHSDQVLETVLLLAERQDLITAKKLVDARQKLREILAILAEIQGLD